MAVTRFASSQIRRSDPVRIVGSRWHRPRGFFGPLELKSFLYKFLRQKLSAQRHPWCHSQPTIGRVGIMNKRTGESVISTDMVKKARRSTSAVEEKRRNKDGTACAFVSESECASEDARQLATSR